MKFFSIVILQFFLVSFIATSLKSQEYTFGKGYKIGNSSFYLGGYLSVEYEKTSNQKSYLIDDLAFILYLQKDRWDFISEFEASDLYVKNIGKYNYEKKNFSFHIERLNATYYIDEYQTIQIGKFNSPIGFWNIMPINVLRDTTSNPYIIENTFPKLTSGLCYRYFFDEKLSDSIYITIQNNNDIDSNYNNFNINRHYAVTLESERENQIFKISVGYFKEINNNESLYSLFAYKIKKDSLTLSLESAFREQESITVIPYNIYLQSVWDLNENYSLILRFETYKDKSKDLDKDNSSKDTEDNNIYEKRGILGLSYRPYPNMALKGEYDKSSNNSKWLFSFSVIF